jgi:tricarballylate dehydrogenase
MANIKETADILDVLVIGSGIAGLSAAVSACDAGARVTILERSTEEEYGGNTTPGKCPTGRQPGTITV